MPYLTRQLNPEPQGKPQLIALDKGRLLALFVKGTTALSYTDWAQDRLYQGIMDSRSSPLYPAIAELLMRHGIPPQRAFMVAMNELRFWSLEDVEAILQRINRPSFNHCPLKDTDPDPDKSFFRRHFPKVIPSSFVRPSLSLVRQSVQERKALCVNKACEFKLCDGEYMAVSHVWAEGIRADFQGRGLTRRHIARIFNTLSSITVEWLWLDVLAVPNADPQGDNLSEEEKRLQIEVINTLPQVYSNASAVVILDALLLQLHAGSALDVAVAIVCGTWLTRVWTYQEIRLAKSALFVTAKEVYPLAEIISEVEELIGTTDEEVRQHSPYYDLLVSLDVLQYVRDIGLSLSDICFSSANRQSTFEIDYARSLFAVLNLTWDAKWKTSAEGMQAIYTNYKEHAGDLAAMFGAKRLSASPRWAPARL